MAHTIDMPWLKLKELSSREAGSSHGEVYHGHPVICHLNSMHRLTVVDS